VAARGSRHTRFTALLHHVDEAALLRAFQRQRRAASAGVDGMTVESYERDLERNIRGLCDRVHSGRYRPQPVRRTFIPKADGGHRPLGVPHTTSELHSYPIDLWDRLKSRIRFIHCVGGGSSF
jgi:retron-type reverse transcriptase